MNPGTAGGTRPHDHRRPLLPHGELAMSPTTASSATTSIMSNNAMLAGHCVIGDFVILGGGAGMHQFVRIGAHAFIGGLSAVENDVIPYGMALGNRAYLAGLNIVGLKRRGFSPATRSTICAAPTACSSPTRARSPSGSRTWPRSSLTHPTVHEILDFIREGGERAICTPRDVAGPA